MAKKTREQLLEEKLQNINARSGGGNHFYKPGKEPEQIRMIPYVHGDGLPSVEVAFHYDVAGIRSVVCPAVTYGKECPVCDFAEVFKVKGGDDNYAIYKKYHAKIRTYSAIVVRGKEDQGVKLWGYGVGIDKEITKKSLNPDYNDLEDAKAGHDLVVSSIPAGAPGNNTSYPQPEMEVRIKPTPLADSVAKMKEIIKSVPNILEDDGIFNKMDHDGLLELVEKLGSEDFDESDDPIEEALSMGNDRGS